MSGAAQAFIAFLRCEAKQSEERAKGLRATAATIEANNLDGNAARYKKRKREGGSAESHDLSEQPPKRETPSGYALFYQENYALIRKSRPPGAPEREAISLVAAQWTSISDEEKLAWQFRAEESDKASLQLQRRHQNDVRPQQQQQQQQRRPEHSAPSKAAGQRKDRP